MVEDVDVDRYRVGDSQRQVLLAARELSRDLPGKGITWVNRRLQYTDGYGLVMAPAADKTPDGRPVFTIADIPPVAPPSLGVTQPAIYYGEEDLGYRIVNTSVPEFDYPSGDENVYTSYKGHGDVVLDSWLKRLVFAWQQFAQTVVVGFPGRHPAPTSRRLPDEFALPASIGVDHGPRPPVPPPRPAGGGHRTGRYDFIITPRISANAGRRLCGRAA